MYEWRRLLLRQFVISSEAVATGVVISPGLTRGMTVLVSGIMIQVAETIGQSWPVGRLPVATQRTVQHPMTGPENIAFWDPA